MVMEVWPWGPLLEARFVSRDDRFLLSLRVLDWQHFSHFADYEPMVFGDQNYHWSLPFLVPNLISIFFDLMMQQKLRYHAMLRFNYVLAIRR